MQMKNESMRMSSDVQERVSNQDVRKILEKRKVYIEKLISDKENALIKAPSGKLRINKFRDKWQFYHREKPESKNGVYIPQEKEKFIHSLAQKSYDEKVLHEAEMENRIIRQTLEYYRGETIETVFEKLSEGRKLIVEPIEETPEEFVRKWNAVTYSGKEFSEGAPELFTDRGERVRSKSELIIANILYKKGVPYRYECPVQLKGFGTVYPDFTVLNVEKRKEYFLEHLGMMDDPVYAEHALQKIQSYIASGIYPGENLILTAETRQHPLNIKIVQQLISKYCCE